MIATPAAILTKRLESLGVVISDLERTYAGRVQLRDWAPSWSAEMRFGAGSFPFQLRGMSTMTLLCRSPLSHWAFLHCSRDPNRYELFAESTVQKPPFGLKKWPST